MNFQECFNKPLFDQAQINLDSSASSLYSSRFSDKENITKGIGLFGNVNVVSCSTEQSTQDNKFKLEDKQSKENILNKNNIFKCERCKEIIDKNCVVCQGKTQINGEDNLVKFFQYILEFKLGKKSSYSNNKMKPRQSVNSFCYEVFQQNSQIPLRNTLSTSYGRYSEGKKSSQLSQSNILQKYQQRKSIHKGYYCDRCKISPISGNRYHCQHCVDFDLCDECYKENGHQHQMKKITTTSTHNQISALISQSFKINHTKNQLTQSFSSTRVYSSLIG